MYLYNTMYNIKNRKIERKSWSLALDILNIVPNLIFQIETGGFFRHQHQLKLIYYFEYKKLSIKK